MLRALPAAGVRAASRGHGAAGPDAVVDGEVSRPFADGWSGAPGKDFSVWSGPAVRDLAEEGLWVQRCWLDVVAGERAAGGLADGRRPDLDQLVRQALLVLSSDWAFMVTRDQAAGYARDREAGHRARFHRLAALLEVGPREARRRTRCRRRVASAARTTRSRGSTRGRSRPVGRMRVLHVAWEHPPVVYGGLGHLVAALAAAQAAAGHQVGVLALGHDVTGAGRLRDVPAIEVRDGVRVQRVPLPGAPVGAWSGRDPRCR